MKDDEEGELVALTITGICPFCGDVVTQEDEETRYVYGEDWWDGEMVVALADLICVNKHKFTVRLG